MASLISSESPSRTPASVPSKVPPGTSFGTVGGSGIGLGASTPSTAPAPVPSPVVGRLDQLKVPPGTSFGPVGTGTPTLPVGGLTPPGPPSLIDASSAAATSAGGLLYVDASEPPIEWDGNIPIFVQPSDVPFYENKKKLLDDAGICLSRIETPGHWQRFGEKCPARCLYGTRRLANLDTASFEALRKARPTEACGITLLVFDLDAATLYPKTPLGSDVGTIQLSIKDGTDKLTESDLQWRSVLQQMWVEMPVLMRSQGYNIVTARDPEHDKRKVTWTRQATVMLGDANVGSVSMFDTLVYRSVFIRKVDDLEKASWLWPAPACLLLPIVVTGELSSVWSPLHILQIRRALRPSVPKILVVTVYTTKEPTRSTDEMGDGTMVFNLHTKQGEIPADKHNNGVCINLASTIGYILAAVQNEGRRPGAK